MRIYTKELSPLLIIVSNKWSKHIKDWWKDPSGSGVVSSVTIKAMSHDITIFGTYWPFMRVGKSHEKSHPPMK